MTSPADIRETVEIWSARETRLDQVEIVETKAPPQYQVITMTVGSSWVYPGSYYLPVTYSAPSEHMQTAIEELQSRLDQATQRITELEERVTILESQIPTQEVVVLREISREQAKREVLEAFQSGETLFYSDIAKRLRIDLELAVELCEELRKEGEIYIDADYAF
jgi:hypothetical protein